MSQKCVFFCRAPEYKYSFLLRKRLCMAVFTCACLWEWSLVIKPAECTFASIWTKSEPLSYQGVCFFFFFWCLCILMRTQTLNSCTSCVFVRLFFSSPPSLMVEWINMNLSFLVSCPAGSYCGIQHQQLFLRQKGQQSQTWSWHASRFNSSFGERMQTSL